MDKILKQSMEQTRLGGQQAGGTGAELHAQARALLSSVFEDASATAATNVILGTSDLPKVSSKALELST